MTAEHEDRIIKLHSRRLHEKFNTPQFLDNIKLEIILILVILYQEKRERVIKSGLGKRF